MMSRTKLSKEHIDKILPVLRQQWAITPSELVICLLSNEHHRAQESVRELRTDSKIIVGGRADHVARPSKHHTAGSRVNAPDK